MFSSTGSVSVSTGGSYILAFDDFSFLERADGFVSIEYSDGLPQSETLADVDLFFLFFFYVYR